MPVACLQQSPPFPGPLLLGKAALLFRTSLWQQGSELKEGLGCELGLPYLGSACGSCSLEAEQNLGEGLVRPGKLSLEFLSEEGARVPRDT